MRKFVHQPANIPVPGVIWGNRAGLQVHREEAIIAGRDRIGLDFGWIHFFDAHTQAIDCVWPFCAFMYAHAVKVHLVAEDPPRFLDFPGIQRTFKRLAFL